MLPIRSCGLKSVLPTSSQSSNDGQNEHIVMEAILKGNHRCPLTVGTGESFSLEKKIGGTTRAYSEGVSDND